MKIKFLFLILFFFNQGTIFSQNLNSIVFNEGNYEVVTIRTGVKGTTVFKVFSYGRNDKTALKSTKPDAVRAVLFKGIPGSDSSNPLISDLSIVEKNTDFFMNFFKNDLFLNFVTSSNDGSINPEDRMVYNNSKVKIGIAVTVNKDALRKYLESNNIIKALNNGF
jgi:hypothetical protein